MGVVEKWSDSDGGETRKRKDFPLNTVETNGYLLYLNMSAKSYESWKTLILTSNAPAYSFSFSYFVFRISYSLNAGA